MSEDPWDAAEFDRPREERARASAAPDRQPGRHGEENSDEFDHHRPRADRSRRTRGRGGVSRAGRRLIALAALAAILYWHRESELTAATAVFVCVGGFLLFILFTASRQKRWDAEPVPAGRVVAVVPAFNEDPETLHASIESLLNQTHRIDAVYVVDDGSDVPAPVYRHPRVHWTRTINGGKRRAQVVGLQGEQGRADFVVTVDSDSVVAPDGVERLLRAFSDRRVQAATGLPVLRNRTRNLITRITDMEIVYGCLTLRSARSALGSVIPTSGAFAAYRADVIFDNLADYLTSGTYSDDRRLTHYALERGRVVSVDEAVVETEMPATPRTVFKQRLRWFKGSFKWLPWELRHLRATPLAFRVWNLSMFLAYPIFIVHGVAFMPLTGQGVSLTPVLYWLSLLYIQAFYYVIGRTGVPLAERLLSWILLTPLVSLYQMALIRPAMYWATTQVKKESWATRGSTAATDEGTIRDALLTAGEKLVGVEERPADPITAELPVVDVLHAAAPHEPPPPAPAPTMPGVRDISHPSGRAQQQGSRRGRRAPQVALASGVVMAALALALVGSIWWSAATSESRLNASPGSATVVEVPSLVGLTVEDAIDQLSTVGLHPGHQQLRKSDAVPAGRVIETEPGPGVRVAMDQPIDLVVSVGVSPATVPEVIGGTLERARQALTAKGLRVGKVQEQDSPYPRGTVLGSQPRAGAVVPPATEVSLVVASGWSTVPDVRNLSLGQAASALTDAGFTVGDTATAPGQSPAGTPPGVVLRTQPGAGSRAQVGTTVALFTSPGTPTPTPSVSTPVPTPTPSTSPSPDPTSPVPTSTGTPEPESPPTTASPTPDDTPLPPPTPPTTSPPPSSPPPTSPGSPPPTPEESHTPDPGTSPPEEGTTTEPGA